jgi:hypothetical protein
MAKLTQFVRYPLRLCIASLLDDPAAACRHCTALHCTALHCTALHCTPDANALPVLATAATALGRMRERCRTTSTRALPRGFVKHKGCGRSHCCGTLVRVLREYWYTAVLTARTDPLESNRSNAALCCCGRACHGMPSPAAPHTRCVVWSSTRARWPSGDTVQPFGRRTASHRGGIRWIWSLVAQIPRGTVSCPAPRGTSVSYNRRVLDLLVPLKTAHALTGTGPHSVRRTLHRVHSLSRRAVAPERTQGCSLPTLTARRHSTAQHSTAQHSTAQHAASRALALVVSALPRAVVDCTQHVACCMLHVACCMLHIARCMLHIARCTVHV